MGDWQLSALSIMAALMMLCSCSSCTSIISPSGSITVIVCMWLVETLAILLPKLSSFSILIVGLLSIKRMSSFSTHSKIASSISSMSSKLVFIQTATWFPHTSTLFK